MADLASLYAKQNATYGNLMGLAQRAQQFEQRQDMQERRLDLDERKYQLEFEKQKQEIAGNMRTAKKEQRENAQAALEFGSRIAAGVAEQDNPLGFLEGRSMGVQVLQNNGLGDLVEKYNLKNAPRETWAFLARLGLDLSKAPELTSYDVGSETVTRETTPLGGTQEVARSPRWKTDTKAASILLPDGSTTGGRTVNGQLQIQDDQGQWVDAPAGSAPFTRRVEATSVSGLAEDEPREALEAVTPPPEGASVAEAAGVVAPYLKDAANTLAGALELDPAFPDYAKSKVALQSLATDTQQIVTAAQRGRPAVMSEQQYAKTLPARGDSTTEAMEKARDIVARIDNMIAVADRDAQNRGATRQFRQKARSDKETLQQLRLRWTNLIEGGEAVAARKRLDEAKPGEAVEMPSGATVQWK